VVGIMAEGATSNRKSAREIKGKKDLKFLLDEVIELDPDNRVTDFLHGHGYKTLQGILTLDDDTINSGEWVDKSGDIQRLSLRERIELKILRAWNAFLLDEQIASGVRIPNIDWSDPKTVSAADYDDFKRNRYLRATTSQEFRPFSGQKPIMQNWKIKVKKGNFLKNNVKRDKNHYSSLEDESLYEEWRIQTISTIYAHQCEEIIDNSPIPSNPEQKLQFDQKNTYLYDVLLSKVKTTMGKHFMRMYKDTRDASSAWKAYDGYMRSSSIAKIKSNNLMKELTSLKFDPRTSTSSQKFIIDWLEKLERFEDFTPLSSHFPDEMKKTLLENALSGAKTFKDITTQETITLAQGGSSIPYMNYVTIVKKLAADFDDRSSKYPGFKRDIQIVSGIFIRWRAITHNLMMRILMTSLMKNA